MFSLERWRGFHRRDMLRLVRRPGDAAGTGLELEALPLTRKRRRWREGQKQLNRYPRLAPGGPATIDMWDLRPAPEGIKGERKVATPA